MKKKNLLKIAFTLLITIVLSFPIEAQTTIYTLDFESSGGYTTSVTENISETTDYFGRIQSGVDSPNPTITNLQGSYYFGAQDIDGIGSAPTLPVKLNINDINVAGYTSLQLRVYLAEDDDGTNQDWDAADFVHFSVDIDNTGTFIDVLNIEAIGGTNSAPAIDTNFDGVGNGTEITDVFTQFTSNISGTGSLIDVQVSFSLDSGDEDIAIDHIEIIGVLATSDPLIGFDNASSSETETNTSFEVLVPVTVSNYSSDQIDIDIEVTGGTAEVADYTLNTTSLSFSADGSQNVSVDINPDSNDFDDETIILTLTETSSVSGLTISRSTHTITVTEDETPPSIGFDTATSGETETNITFTSANIPITVSNYSGTQVDINVSVTGGTAEVGDYTFTSPTALSFIADGTQNITVDINDDADTDAETIILTITETSSVPGLLIAEATHTLTITDDETPAAPSLIISEIADTADNADGRFVEIYNNGESTIDFSVTPIYISRFTNGNPVATGSNVEELTTGTLVAGQYLVIAASGTNFTTLYGYSPDEINGGYSVNGDDPFGMYSGTYPNGTLFDVYGEIGVDGTGQSWEYEDSRAIRNNIMESPSTTWQASSWTISTTNIANATPGASENEFRYDGAWKPRDVYANATTTDDIYISSDVTLTANLSINDFEVATSQIATINSGISLIVNGTSSGNVTYNTTLGSENWYLVSSPAAGETYNNDYVSSNNLAINGTNNAIATYTTGSDGWSYMQTGGGATFSTGTGYSVRRETGAGSGTISFTGTINTSDVPASVVTGGNGGFNLIGNPYTSYLNSATFLQDNTGSLVSETIWVWNQASGVYETKVTATDFVLAPTQGFFVSANAATNLNIAESYQTTTGNAFQKTSKTEVTLLMTDGANNRFAKLYYLKNATTGFDNGYDGETFGGIVNNLDVSTHLVANSQGKNYQLQSLPNSDYENMVIPIGLKIEANKEITFSAEALNLPADINVYLEDRLTNTFTRLDEANSSYKVTSDVALDGIGRFYLHTKTSSALNVDTVNMDNISIYKTTNANLRVVGISQGKASIKLYSILGKQVFENSFTSNGIQDITIPNLATGIYIVQLETETGSLNKKITLE